MAVGRHPATSGAQVVVRILGIDGVGPGQIDKDVVAEIVLDRGRDHVRRVVGVRSSGHSTVPHVSQRGVVLPRIARGLVGVRPAQMQ